MEASSVVKEPGADAVLDLGDGITELLGDRLTLERFDRVRVRLGRHDDERHDGDGGASSFEAVVQARKRLDEHVDTLVAVLVSPGSEHLQIIRS